jgi:hypothetical protein
MAATCRTAPDTSGAGGVLTGVTRAVIIGGSSRAHDLVAVARRESPDPACTGTAETAPHFLLMTPLPL